MTKKIQIRIGPDGTIEAETFGIKGKSCLELIPLLEKIMEAKAVDSDYKPDYYEEDNQLLGEQHVENRNH